jgi:osmotically-inducible protein OsmY
MKIIVNLILSLVLVSLLSSCSMLSVASTVKTVVVADSDRRSVGTITDDNILDISLEAWALDEKIFENSHLNFNVYDGEVLITGEVASAKVKEYLQQNIYTQSANIKRIIDETIIAPTSSLITRTKDSLIDNRISLALNSQEVVNPVHIKVHTENLVIFLMGDVTEREAKKAVEIAAEVGADHGVSKIIKHFNYLKDIPLREKQKAKKREAEFKKQQQKLEKQREIDKKKEELKKQLEELNKQSMEL